MDGKKEVLGMYVGDNESAKFWLSIINGLKNRGVEVYSDHMCGWTDRISTGNRSCISTDRDTTVHH